MKNPQKGQQQARGCATSRTGLSTPQDCSEKILQQHLTVDSEWATAMLGEELLSFASIHLGADLIWCWLLFPSKPHVGVSDGGARVTTLP